MSRLRMPRWFHMATFVILFLSSSWPIHAQPFVSRQGSHLWLHGRPWHFVGVNSYGLVVAASRGDTTFVNTVLDGAAALGCTVVRTWAFSDGSDSLDSSILQYRPGAFNERTFQALDFVVASAKKRGLRLLLPLVNGWDQFGGMNQYVRWRNAGFLPVSGLAGMGQKPKVVGQGTRSYIASGPGPFTHDDFYTDPVMRSWYIAYVRTMTLHTNSLTGIAYGNDPTILGWELANEPRSSDRTGRIVSRWLDTMSATLKSLAPRQLIGTGEEGFDTSPAAYHADRYEGQTWLFDGTNGISFSDDAVLYGVDLASIHLYPDFWNVTRSAGTDWIVDHAGLAARADKVLLLGEFGVKEGKAATYDSWLGTLLLEGGGGALVWQLDPHPEVDEEGFAFWCSGNQPVCSVLQDAAARYARSGEGDSAESVSSVVLSPGFPNPFTGQATIAFDLTADGPITIDVFDMLGQQVREIAAGFRHAGRHRELLDARGLASGAYIIRLRSGGVVQSRRVILLR